MICRNVFAATLCAAFFLLSPAIAQDIDKLKTGGPYVPTPQVVVDQMLKLGAVNEKDYVIDLGSGDGIIVLTAARSFKAGGMGIDIDPDLVRQSNASAQKSGVADRVKFVQMDVFKADLSKASVLPIAEKGVVGRGVLLDMARFRKKECLDIAETFTHEDLMACAKAQGCEIQKRDILVIRTGWIASSTG